MCFAFAVALVIAANLFAAPPEGTAPPKIGAVDASKFYGREMTVTGRVAQVTIRPGITFINLDKPYPKSPCTLVIFPRALARFRDLRTLKNASVEATGKIAVYHLRPEIVLETTNQLKVTSLGTTNAAPLH